MHSNAKTNNEEEQERGATRKEEERAKREHMYKNNNKKTKTVHAIQTIERQENVTHSTQQTRTGEDKETR